MPWYPIRPAPKPPALPAWLGALLFCSTELRLELAYLLVFGLVLMLDVHALGLASPALPPALLAGEGQTHTR